MADTLVVSPVRTRSELKKFISFPYALYKKELKNPYWAAPLRIDEKILQIANRLKRPRAGMDHRDREADDRAVELRSRPIMPELGSRRRAHVPAVTASGTSAS